MKTSRIGKTCFPQIFYIGMVLSSGIAAKPAAANSSEVACVNSYISSGALGEKLVKTLSPEEMKAEVLSIASRQESVDPDFPKDAYVASVTQALVADESLRGKSLDEALSAASAQFIAQEEAARAVARTELISAADRAMEETRKDVAACKAQPCSVQEEKAIAGNLKKIFEKTCLGSRPTALKNLAKLVGLFWAGLYIDNRHRNAAAREAGKPHVDFPWDVAASYSIWFTIMGEVGCRKTLGTVSNPAKTVAPGAPVSNLSYVRAFYTKNYLGYLKYVPAITATSVFFRMISDKLKNKTQSASSYEKMFAGLLVYDAGPGTFIRMTLDLSFLKAFPFLSGRVDKLVNAGIIGRLSPIPAASRELAGKLAAGAIWYPAEWLMRVDAAQLKSKFYFDWLGCWNKATAAAEPTPAPSPGAPPPIVSEESELKSLIDGTRTVALKTGQFAQCFGKSFTPSSLGKTLDPRNFYQAPQQKPPAH